MGFIKKDTKMTSRIQAGRGAKMDGISRVIFKADKIQQGLKSRRFIRGRYSGQEDILYGLDREVLKALGHNIS
jgi:hypothetical protein